MANPLDVDDLRPRVQSIIDETLARQCTLLASISPDLAPMVDAIESLLAGGKRLRPAFCYWGWRGAGGSVSDGASAIKSAAALEFLQACALIHDDVMDGSDTRRGMPAAHRRFAGLHREASWLGSPENFGIGAAILLGDLCLSWADELLMASGFDPESAARGKAIYDEMRTELMAGQYLDLLEQARGGGSVVRALKVVRYKSAKYTIERPLHLGGALAGGDPEVMAAYSGYGLPLGEAFQLRDDILGVFGDPAETGKPAGDDLREGKRTLLIAVAVERSSPKESEVIRRYLGDPGLDEEGVAALRTIINNTGALRHTESMIDHLLNESLTALHSSSINPFACEVLEGLAHAATQRTV